MSTMEKAAVGARTGGFMQQRKGTRPYRASTLMGKEDTRKPSDVFEPTEPTDVDKAFQSDVASLASEEFAQKEAAKKEFAPGIPASREIKSIPKVKEKADNEEWTVSLAKHPAAVRGDHYDLRLVDPKGRAHSWAFNDTPAPGKGTYAAQQPTHTGRYARRTKPFTIPPGYGATRPGAKVEPVHVQPAEVVSASNNRVHFLRHHGQQTEEMVLKRLSRPIKGSRQSPMWALRNVTKNRQTAEGKRIPDFKPKYRDVAPENVDLDDDAQVMTAKLDGAHTIVDFPKPGRMVRTYSYRPTSRKTGLIEHTFKFPGFQRDVVPKGLKNTIVRAETWGVGPDGKAIPPQELGGVLNAGVPKSRRMQEERGITLQRTGIDVVRFKGRDYQNKPYSEKLKALRQISKATKGAIMPPLTAEGAKAKKKLLRQIKSGKLPMTREGVVLQTLDKAEAPSRVKFRPDHDVYVREVFTKPRGGAKGQAGGFAYSWDPDGPIAGRVGTGFSQAMRSDMYEHPERYVGRVAKVKSQDRFQNRKDPSQLGALRAPSFKGWHIDKTDPALMEKEAAVAVPTVKDIKAAMEKAHEEADPERLAEAALYSRTGRAIKPLLEARPVKEQVGRIRSKYRRLVGKEQ